MNRRGFLKSCLAFAAAPAIVHASNIMRVQPIVLPGDAEFEWIAGETNYHVFSEEMAELVRRVWVPKMVAQIYTATPLMAGLMKVAEAEDRILRLDPFYGEMEVTAMNGT